MKTDALISVLANHVAPVPPRAALHRLALGLVVGVAISFAIMLATLGIRHDWNAVLPDPMFWLKVLFPAALAAAGLALTQQLGRPGVRVRSSWLGVMLPVLLVWTVGAWQWSNAPESARATMLFGHTWRTCPLLIVMLALPIWIGGAWALRGLAPLRPAVAGAAAGVMAGGAGAAVYALHCPENSASFLAVWYIAGIALSALLGAFAGRHLLRW